MPKQKEQLNKKCPICNESFVTTKNNKIYCNRWCALESQRRNSKLYEGYRGANHDGICIVCGGEFFKKTRHNVFCSDKCRNSRRNNPLRLQTPIVREYFLEKANFTCEKCGSTSGEFQIHHIVPVYRGGGDDESNLMVLCSDCHKNEHQIFGVV